ncbi:MAG TPA: ABC transporter ATP-binding protein [Ilumatobacteraceae bacterium]|nr:ABC transporter ATP-binding protein [Ilumatobacteraceae bacterium]
MSELVVEGLTSGYDDAVVIEGVSFTVPERGVTALVGPNGAGKTTLLKTLMGLVPVARGTITFDGHDITATRPRQRARLGIALVAEGRGLFPDLTVGDNLRLGASAVGHRPDGSLDRVLELFPELHRLAPQRAGSLSGGEQQMCAIGRSLMAQPALLVIDELSLGLAPVVVDRLADAVRVLARDSGRPLAIVLVEQNVDLALDLADRALGIFDGRLFFDGSAAVARDQIGRFSDAVLGIAPSEPSTSATNLTIPLDFDLQETR